jgi:hypothetical protein
MGLLSNWSARAFLLHRTGAERARSGHAAPQGGYAEQGGGWENVMERLTWEAICRRDEFRGRWVALDGCRYDEGSGRAVEGSVVDVDDDLVELCTRIRESEYKNCAILFCGEDGEQEPPSGDDDPFQHTAH